MAKSTTIISVERALKVLLLMAEWDRPAGVTETSNSLKVPKASISRILSTFKEYDFVIQNPETETFCLGPGILRVSEKVRLKDILVQLARPFLGSLAEKTGEVSNLGIIHNRKVLVLSSVERLADSRITVHLGPIAELHCSSLGKALLVDKSPHSISSLVGDPPFPALTANTKTTLEELREEINTVKSTGISIDNEETEEGLMCIGAPIQDWNGKVLAAISVSAPKSRLIGQRFKITKNLVAQVAAEISDRVTSRDKRI